MTSHEGNRETDVKTESDAAGGRLGAALVGLLVIQLIIGYEWLWSGISKIAAGTFVSGLGGQLMEVPEGAAQWYVAFLNNWIIPNAVAFGYIIEYAEVLAGVALIAGPLVWIFAWNRTPYRLKVGVIAVMIAAAIGGIFMAMNFHLAVGSNHPWGPPESPFDEAVDIDVVLTAIQVAITAVQISYLIRLRRARTSAVAIPSMPQSK